MTLVCGIAEGGHVFIGADRATSYEDDTARVVITRNRKVFRVGRLLIGSSGSGRVQNVLRAIAVPKHPKGMSAFDYVSITIVAAIRRALQDAGALVPAVPGDGTPEMMPFNSSILIGYRRGLYTIGEDFGCDESNDDFDAIGSGAVHALAKLSGPGDPKARLLAALRWTERNCWSVRKPFDIEVL